MDKNFSSKEVLTISNAPRMTPHSTLLYHNPPCRASSGNSTNSAKGFSSKVNVKNVPGALDCGCGVDDFEEEDGGGGTLCVTPGVTFRKDLNPTYQRERSQ